MSNGVEWNKLQKLLFRALNPNKAPSFTRISRGQIIMELTDEEELCRNLLISRLHMDKQSFNLSKWASEKTGAQESWEFSKKKWLHFHGAPVA